uniref:Cl19897_1 n=1 Tax=Arundo donax TaxID=35708 RepID=A0A0A9DNM1_ARUDO
MLQYICTFSYEGELQLWTVRLRLNHFHMNPNSLEDSITDVCSRLGYSLVYLVNHPITSLVSLWRKVDWAFYAEPGNGK